MKSPLVLSAVVAAASLACSSVSYAALIASYDMTGYTGTAPTGTFPSVDVELNSTASNLTPSSVLQTNPVGPRSGASGTGGNPVPGAFTRSPESYTDSYWEFTATPDLGYEMSLTQLQFEYKLSSTDGGFPSFTGNVYVANSIDGFPVSSPTPTDSTTTTVGIDQTPWKTVTVSLGAGFTDLTVPVTFRIYVWDDRATGGAIMRYDNLHLDGTVDVPAPEVPEPASLGLLAFGTLALIARRRRTH